MAHDDDKPEAGDDPWAGLDGDGLPELGGDFSFSFDDEPTGEAAADALDDAIADALADDSAPEPAAPDDGFDEPADEPTVLAFGRSAEADSEVAAEALQEPDDLFAEVADGGDDGEAEAGGSWEMPAADEASIDAWLTDAPDAATAASSVLPFDTAHEPPANVAETADFTSSQSSVDIGTGHSGIISASGIESMAELDGQAIPGSEPDSLQPEADMFAFAAEPEAADALTGDAGGLTEAGDAIDAFVVAGGAAAVAAGQALPAGEAKPRAAGATRTAAAGRRKPSVIGQLAGVVAGGALAIPITLAILIWGFGKDPFGLAPLVPESLSFLVPAKFRPGVLGGDAIDLAGAASLDAVVGDAQPADDGAVEPQPAADASSAEPVAVAEPGSPAEPSEPEPVDLAAIDPLPAAGLDEPASDPLMDLLDEEGNEAPVAAAPVDALAALPAASAPLEPPAPEPLDLGDLDEAVAAAAAGLEALIAEQDPADHAARTLLAAAWYRDLARYAQELTNLERLAAETGRPFEPAVERVAAVQSAIAAHPELLDGLAGLTREWVAYTKRASDGLVMPATFIEARRVGPYWRARVTLPADAKRPAAEMVVLTRVEPAVASGESVLVTGLVVDDDVVWAADLRPAVAAEVFPGL